MSIGDFRRRIRSSAWVIRAQKQGSSSPPWCATRQYRIYSDNADDGHKPISVEELALGLPRCAWRKITWREGSCERLSSCFARVRVRAAHRDSTLTEPRPEEWLLVEWPEGEEKPTKYWFSTLPKTIAFRKLVDIAKLRWRIERDYQELKQEVGLTSKGEVGAASIITPRCASRPTDSWSPRGRRFPLRTSSHRAVRRTCRSPR
jgi:hypothetical protein